MSPEKAPSGWFLMFLPVSITVRAAHTHPRNAPFPLQPGRLGVPDSHERTTSKSRKPSFAFHGRRDTLVRHYWSAGGRPAGFPSRPLSCFDLCPDFSESFDGRWMKKLLATSSDTDGVLVKVDLSNI